MYFSLISQKDGIHIDGEEKIVIDSSSGSGDVNLVSHAHSDHAVKGNAEVVASELTAEITGERFDVEIDRKSHEKIELKKSGHILGSSAALIRDSILYTGDVSLQDRLYLEGFQPVDAEKLIVEATYGIPAYKLPEQREVVKQIRDWVQDTDKPLLLFGYSLGKAQKIQQIVQKATDRRIIAHGAVKRMNEVVESNTELEFRAEPYGENKDALEENGIAVLPSRVSRSDLADNLVEKYGAVKAGFSGWAVQESFKYRGDYDKIFALSDHCGFDDLVKLVEEVDPEKVYTHHGFDEAFASYLSRELGYNARALKNNQTSLNDFS